MGGRRGRVNATTAPAGQPNYRQLRHPFTPQSVFSEDEVSNVHDTALRVLEELGVKVLLPEAPRMVRGQFQPKWGRLRPSDR